MEINGRTVTDEDIEKYLASKRVTLWSDWCITDPGRMTEAIAWFKGEMTGLAASLS